MWHWPQVSGSRARATDVEWRALKVGLIEAVSVQRDLRSAAVFHAAFIKDPTPELEQATTDYRGRSKGYAVDWIDFASAANMDYENARTICLSASGSISACQR